MKSKNFQVIKTTIIFLVMTFSSTFVAHLFALEANSTDAAIAEQLQKIQRLQQLAQNQQPSNSYSTLPQMPGATNQQNASQMRDLYDAVSTNSNLAGASNQSATAAQMQSLNQQQLTASPPAANYQYQGGSPTSANPNQPSDVNQLQSQSMQQMVSASPDDVLREQAYQATTKNLLPMTPDQIQRLRQQYKANQFAAENDVAVPPRPVASSKIVSLAPGSTPPVIRLSQGFVSSLVFVDSTGAPWPIKSYDLGNPGAFNIQWDKKSHTLMIQASKLYTYGNLAVELEGSSTPVMITLIPGQKAVDYRVDLRVQGLGPNAKSLPSGDGLPAAANPVLLGVLDGVPPEGSTTQEILGGNAQAWLKGDRLFLRTRLTLLSPSWISTMASADGTKAYELQNAATLLVSDRGKLSQLTVRKAED